MNTESVETVIIGAGQQGCGVAGALQEIGHDAIVFEKGEVGQRWAHERWDSLLVGSGNRSIRLPRSPCPQDHRWPAICGAMRKTAT